MIRNLTLLAISVSALVGLAITTAQGEAGARWKDSGSDIASNQNVSLLGFVKFENATFGSIECPVEAAAVLTSGTSALDLNSFTVPSGKTSECKLEKGISFFCPAGVVGHESTSLPWAGTGTKSGAIDITGFKFHIFLDGPSCMTKKITLEGSPVATLNSTSAATSAQLSGQILGTHSDGSSIGNFNVTGSLSLSPTGTFGIG